MPKLDIILPHNTTIERYNVFFQHHTDFIIPLIICQKSEKKHEMQQFCPAKVHV